jgi:hypothetical protein
VSLCTSQDRGLERPMSWFPMADGMVFLGRSRSCISAGRIFERGMLPGWGVVRMDVGTFLRRP